MMQPTHIVILDRDGTINHERDDFVKSPEEWVPLPGALEAIARLNHAGWKAVVVTNQSGFGRGLFTAKALGAMHIKMNKLLQQVGGRIEAVFFCPHKPDDACDCRKPLPGLMLEAGKRFNANLSAVAAVGDSLRDLQAAVAAGCQPHLVRSGRGLATEAAGSLVPGTVVHDDLAAFAEHLIAQERLVRGTVGKTDAGFDRLL
jgi:D-glycero-D-manno-heptose 1,7-bisphosphate phosphatase